MHISYDHNRIRVIDHFMSGPECQQVIDLFEQDSARHRARTGEWVNLTELSLAEPPGRNPIRALKTQVWQPFLDRLTEQFSAVSQQYALKWGQHEGVDLLPQEWSMEGARVKCYRPNGRDQFRLHVDVANRASSSRFLSFLLYLNDSDAGTEFPLEAHTVAAEQGRLLMFPPLWCYPHAGLMPQDGRAKYILSSYLHYI